MGEVEGGYGKPEEAATAPDLDPVLVDLPLVGSLLSVFGSFAPRSDAVPHIDAV